MSIKVWTKKPERLAAPRTEVPIVEGQYNEYYLPALIDQREEMWIEVTDKDGVVTLIHLKR